MAPSKDVTQDNPCDCPSEGKILRKVLDDTQPGQFFLPRLLDEFNLEGPYDRYDCFVTDVFGENLGKLRRHKWKNTLPWDVMKQAVLQVLLALSHLHGQQIVHGELLTENILLALPLHSNDVVADFLAHKEVTHRHQPGPLPTAVSDIVNIDTRLIHFSNAHDVASPTAHRFINQPENYRAPEVILGAPWGTPVDIWNLGTLAYEWATSHVLFLPDDLLSRSHALRDDGLHQILNMTKMFGKFPPKLVEGASERLKHCLNSDESDQYPADPTVFEDVIIKHLLLDPDRPTIGGADVSFEEMALFTHFLSLIFKLDPAERATAEHLLTHPWLDDVAERLTKRMEGLAEQKLSTSSFS